MAGVLAVGVPAAAQEATAQSGQSQRSVNVNRNAAGASGGNAEVDRSGNSFSTSASELRLKEGAVKGVGGVTENGLNFAPESETNVEEAPFSHYPTKYPGRGCAKATIGPFFQVGDGDVRGGITANIMVDGTTQCESAEKRTKMELRYKAWQKRVEAAKSRGETAPPMPEFLQNIEEN